MPQTTNRTSRLPLPPRHRAQGVKLFRDKPAAHQQPSKGKPANVSRVDTSIPVKHPKQLPARSAGKSASLSEHADVIRLLGKRTVADIIEIGRRLTECKDIVGHGNWLPWLEREFDWSDSTALNFMRVYELGKSVTAADLDFPLRSLYLLGQPSTPVEVRNEIIASAKAGKRIKHSEVVETVRTAKRPKVVKPIETEDELVQLQSPPILDVADTLTVDPEVERLRVRVDALTVALVDLVNLGGIPETPALDRARAVLAMAPV
jgi:hypothetical protein